MDRIQNVSLLLERRDITGEENTRVNETKSGLRALKNVN